MPTENDDTQPVRELLDAMVIQPIPDGWTPLELVVLAKCLDSDGEIRWALRATDGINSEELLGALTVRRDLLIQDILDSFADDD